MYYSIQNYVVISVQSSVRLCFKYQSLCFFSLELVFYSYIGSGSSFLEAAMLHRHIQYTIAQDGQTKQRL